MDHFSFSGYSGSDYFPCFVDGPDIYATDYMGGRKLVGKTAAAYSELEETTTEYYNKLVELGVIVPPKTQEQLMAEMQQSMLDMSGIIKSLSDELKELKSHGSEQCACRCQEDVPNRESKRSNGRGTGGAKGDDGQP